MHYQHYQYTKTTETATRTTTTTTTTTITTISITKTVASNIRKYRAKANSSTIAVIIKINATPKSRQQNAATIVKAPAPKNTKLNKPRHQLLHHHYQHDSDNNNNNNNNNNKNKHNNYSNNSNNKNKNKGRNLTSHTYDEIVCRWLSKSNVSATRLEFEISLKAANFKAIKRQRATNSTSGSNNTVKRQKPGNEISPKSIEAATGKRQQICQRKVEQEQRQHHQQQSCRRSASARLPFVGNATSRGKSGWTWPNMGSVLFATVFIALHFATGGLANPDAKRLYDDLLSNYNRLIRPVGNNSDRLTVKMGLRLSQLIDVNLKNQIMTTNVWVEQEWNDYKLKWNPDDYGGVDTLHVPSEHIWLPDIVLYNNADGNYEVTIMTKAILHHTGKVVWKPPAIYKSFCEIDVEYFPFDEQTCFMKFGSWTYDGYMVDLRHLKQTADSDNIEVGIDLQDYYISVEWDIMRVPAVRNEKFYSCCEEPYLDIVFNLTLRRKTLFYTVNLIIPCVGISFLSVLVFYLPSDSGEKISLCISILLSLTVFFLLLAEIIPPTSLTVPLLGKYLLFTMMLVTLSVVVTIAVLNVNFRSPVTHRMSPWVQRLFIQILPKLLCIERPKKEDPNEDEQPPEVLTDVYHLPPDVDKFVNYDSKRFSGDYGIPALPSHHRFDFTAAGGIASSFGEPPLPSSLPLPGADDDLFSPSGNNDLSPSCCQADLSPTFDKPYMREMEKTIEGSRFIAQHVKNKDKFESVEEDWKYVAMVLDRLFLWIFAIACVVGTALIILQAPSLYDQSQPIDILYSKIAKKKFELLKMGSDNTL